MLRRMSLNRCDFPLAYRRRAPTAGPVGSWSFQNPHSLLPDEPALHRDLRPGSEAKLLAEGGREGGLAFGGDGDDVHAPEPERGSPYSAMYPVRHVGST